MAKDASVVIIGAGASGLTAAAELKRAGVDVTIIEARDRIGGRMFTKQDPHTGAVVELGAEFIHGRPPQIWNLLHKNKIRANTVDGDNFCIQNGELSGCDFFSQIDRVLDKLTDRQRDQPFIQFLRGYEKKHPIPPEIRARTLRYIEGFHAANPRLISVHSLVKGMKADEKIDGEQAYRIPKGYRELLEIFRSRIDDVPVDLNTQVEQIRWNKGEVKITTRGKSKRKIYETIPRADHGAASGSSIQIHKVHTVPLPAQKRQALSKLAMGKVIRVTLCLSRTLLERPPREQKISLQTKFPVLR